MAEVNAVLNDRDAASRIEALRRRWESLNEARIRNESSLAQLEAEMAEAMEQARSRFGTDDLDALRAKIRENYAANTKAIAEFEAAIEKVESAIEAIGREEAAS